MSATPTADAQALRAWECAELDLPAGLELEWLGVSGYRLTYEGVSLFVDPYVSRVPLRALLLRRPAMPDAALLDRYARARPGRWRACSSATPTSTTPSTRPASPAATGPRPTARRRWPPDAPARPRSTWRSRSSAPALRARAVHGPLHPQPPLEAAVRAQGPVRRRAHLRPPRRALPGRLQVRRGVRDPHRGRGASRSTTRAAPTSTTTSCGTARWTCSSRAWPAAASRRATGSGSCPGSTRACSCRPTTTTSSRRSGSRERFVRGVKLSELEDEVSAVSRDARLAALARVDQA